MLSTSIRLLCSPAVRTSNYIPGHCWALEKRKERAKLKHSRAENTSFVNETWSKYRKPRLGQDLQKKSKRGVFLDE